MAKQSTKSKSKRMSLKNKYKIRKKVAEHHRKKRKELRKSGKKDKGPKDPGLPSQWPFKEELIKEFAYERQRILMQEKEKREARKRTREVRQRGGAAEERRGALDARPCSRRRLEVAGGGPFQPACTLGAATSS